MPLRLLFLTPQLPFPPRQGTALRNWGQVRHLGRRHDVSLLSMAEAGQSAEAPELHAACREVIAVPAPRRSPLGRLRTLLTPEPDLARRLWSPDFARALQDVLRRTAFDGVHVEGLELAPYLPVIREHAPGARIVYDAHNAEHLIQARALQIDRLRPARWHAALYSWLQLPRLRAFEARVCRAADQVVCVSAADAAALQSLAPGLRPVILPNAIDVDDYPWPAARLPAGPPRLVFTGKMDYRPNLDAALWFCGDILPRVRARRPEALFQVVGQKPPPRLLQRHQPGVVEVTGAVEDVRPYIARAAVYVAPLRMGGGTRLKLLEAMAMGRAVVSTAVGAEGFEVESGRELVLADTAADFARAVLGLLAEPERARRLGQAGRDFVRAGYDWAGLLPRLEGIYS